VFSPVNSERLNYTCIFIFEHVLNCNFSIISDQEHFQNSDGIKINYSRSTIQNGFQINPKLLLFETNIKEGFIPEYELKSDSCLFFPNSENCDLGFDVFASVFYFISRYQEWQPFDSDRHHRFEISNSIQFKLKQHLKPLVNVWIEQLKNKLQLKFKEVKFPKKKFTYISTIDVDNLYAFKDKGIKRTIAGAIKDIYLLDMKNLKRRLTVVKGIEKDPFDIYDEINDLSIKNSVPLIYFFLQRAGKEFDRTIDPNSGVFEPVFDKLKKDNVSFGLHPSYDAHTNENLMQKEFEIIRSNSNTKIAISRQHYLRFDIRKTPSMLIKNKVLADFTMGFASSPGYRASTFTPFYFFDFKTNESTKLLMVPFAIMDGVYFNYSKVKARDAEDQIISMAYESKHLDGLFVTVFHERTFDELLYPGFKQLYLNLQEKLKA
jgi:hypothetical protein